MHYGLEIIPFGAYSDPRAVVRLETARLVLRNWTPGDIPALMAGLNDLPVARWLAFVPHPYTRADAERWVTHCASLSAFRRCAADASLAATSSGSG